METFLEGKKEKRERDLKAVLIFEKLTKEEIEKSGKLNYYKN